MADQVMTWDQVNQHLGLVLPEGLNQDAWRTFVMELFRQVLSIEEQNRRNYKPRAWDFCVLHSCHPRDVATAKNFKRLLTTSLGLFGITLGEINFGERTLDAAEAMVEGSTKVFVLATRQLSRVDMPRLVYQEVLMEELLQERWRDRMVPLVVQGNSRIPFGLRNIRPLPLLDDPATAEMVSSFISVETQMEVRARRRRSEEIFNNELRRQRARRLEEIRETVTELRHRFGDDYDPTAQLDQMTEALRHITVSDVPGVDQQVNLSNCNNVTVGPSIHFVVRCDDSTTPPYPDSPSTSRHTASTSANHPSTTAATTDATSTDFEFCSEDLTESTYTASVTSP
ncbi:uncharacterized protein LOC123512048 [Portunus trituberculatus]|uniref:uncharacterized protein LOC123512048 n=1 Tax=Portunus trituberculatus TaxID=210409 RepID=UPI001E1CD214|nr:uncharacterized protein LOC123512048 [Portunus trituberculatus]XP_045124145.1 uncharacterized protein LOC123512048 [Portunus trituberculatus]